MHWLQPQYATLLSSDKEKEHQSLLGNCQLMDNSGLKPEPVITL
jgi:hypothetical protein